MYTQILTECRCGNRNGQCVPAGRSWGIKQENRPGPRELGSKPASLDHFHLHTMNIAHIIRTCRAPKCPVLNDSVLPLKVESG